MDIYIYTRVGMFPCLVVRLRPVPMLETLATRQMARASELLMHVHITVDGAVNGYSFQHQDIP